MIIKNRPLLGCMPKRIKYSFIIKNRFFLKKRHLFVSFFVAYSVVVLRLIFRGSTWRVPTVNAPNGVHSKQTALNRTKLP